MIPPDVVDVSEAPVIAPKVVVHVGCSTRGASTGVDDDTPWENRVREAADRDGETLVSIQCAADEMESIQARLTQLAAAVQCDSTLVHTQDHPSKGGAEGKGSVEGLLTTYSLVRKRPCCDHHLDLRVAVVGNVDAGKSTLVGVLTGPVSFLDDGRGLARSRVLRHKVPLAAARACWLARPPPPRPLLHSLCLTPIAPWHACVRIAARGGDWTNFIDR